MDRSKFVPRVRSVKTGRKCPRCGGDIVKRPGGKTECAQCKRDREKKRALSNPEQRAGYSKKYAREIKCAVLKGYGNTCACCMEPRVEFLTVDHMKGDGKKHRLEVSGGNGGTQFYRWLIKNQFPKGFRVLCINCNFSFGMYGYCPHEKERLKSRT